MAIDMRIIEKMAERIARYKSVCGPDRPWRIADYELESDGRKLKALVRELRAEGFLTDAGENDHFIMTEKAWLSIEPKAPDMKKKWLKRFEDHDRFPPVVPFDNLTLAEQKLAIDNPDVYTFHVGSMWNGQGELARFWPGTDEYATLEDDQRFKRRTLAVYVGTAGLTAFAEKHVRECEVEHMYRHSLNAGLRHLGILPKEEPTWFDQSSAFGTQGVSFGHEPAQWEQETEKRIDGVLEEIAEAQRTLARLIGLQRALKAYGGWDKFIADYRAACEESVDARDK